MNEPEIKMLTRFGVPVKHFEDADIVKVNQVYTKDKWEEFMKQNPELFNNQKTK